MKKKIPAFNFIRAICALGIIFYHFIADGKCRSLDPVLKTFPNGSGTVGYELVTVFFIISGTLLYYNHRSIQSVGEFYKKRWLNIFPAFYCAYFIFFLLRMFKGTFVKGKSILLFPLTLFGFDGYLAAFTGFRDWYILGEWFLGAIIVCYIMYPFILKLLERYELETYTVVFFLFFVFIDTSFLKQDSFRNISSCICSFVLGIIISRYSLYEKQSSFVISIIVLIAVYLFPMHQNENLINHMAGVSLFFVLFFIGKKIMLSRKASALFSWIGSISYEIFLLQHVVITKVLKIFNPHETLQTVELLLATTVIILILAEILHRIVRRIVAIFKPILVTDF